MLAAALGTRTLCHSDRKHASDTIYQIFLSTLQDYLVLGHTADQTHSDCSKLAQGRLAMDAVDSDRLRAVAEVTSGGGGLGGRGHYASVRLGSLRPLDCTPKNNLLVGVRREHLAETAADS